jgi:tetrahydromethanopterin S-methyltransferase subunit G
MPNGWEEYKVHVLAEMERMNKKLDTIEREVRTVHREMAFNRGRVWVVVSLLAFGFSILTDVLLHNVLG